jgi:hypothetical protein
METIHKAVSAYGGEKLWSEARFLEAEFSAWGLAFTFKRRPVFNRAKISMDTSRPYSRITPIGKNPAVSGVLDGFDTALEGPGGHIITKRKNARSYFSGARRLLYWDDLDMAYFANYAMWNYLTLPALLMNSDILWKEKASGLLEARFPLSIPTHSPFQQFRFDRDTGLLRQHDYTAEVISGLARAAHVVLAHSQKRGFRYTSHRRVTPRALKGAALPGPTLIEIIIHDCQLK